MVGVSPEQVRALRGQGQAIVDFWQHALAGPAPVNPEVRRGGC
jgi:hypothetical protein